MRSIRISIATISALLIFIGMTMIYSSSGVYAMQVLGDKLYFLKRHLLFLVIGAVGTVGIMVMDYRSLRKWSKPLLLVTIVLLVVVLIPGIGKASYGARRWFHLGLFNFQPSELAKLAVLVYVADFLTRKENLVKSFLHGFLPILLILGIVCVLIVKQPDLGSAVLIFSVSMIMFFVAGGRPKHLASLGLFVLPGFYYLIMRVPYRWTRIITFLNPWNDSQGAGFQLTQAQIAFGSGGFWGLGLGKSVQKLFYLPAAHTDFILSIIGEEVGFAGVFAVISFFICLIWQGARIAKRTNDMFGYYLATGIVALLGLQAVVNVGVSMGALPTKGLPLPFISYGGSALVFNMVFVGLLLNISRVEDS